MSPDWLNRREVRCRLICFDWDAVTEDRTIKGTIVSLVELLLRFGTLIVLSSAKTLDQLNCVCLDFLSPQAKQKLFLSLKSGSEAFAFDSQGAARISFHQAVLAPHDRENPALDWIKKSVTAQFNILSDECEHFSGRELKENAPQFIEFLKRQLEHARSEFSASEEYSNLFLSGWRNYDHSWIVEQEGFDATKERDFESVFALANGYVGSRSALTFPIPISQTDMIFAGIYDHKITSLPYSEVEFKTGQRQGKPDAEIVTVPSAFEMELLVDGKRFSIGKTNIMNFERDLDMRAAILYEKIGLKDDAGKRLLLIRTARFISLDDPHLMVQEMEITSLCGPDMIKIELNEFPRAMDLDVRHPHVKIISHESDHKRIIKSAEYEVSESKDRTKLSFASKIWLNGKLGSEIDGPVALSPGNPLLMRRLISAFTSRDGLDPKETAESHISETKWENFSEICGKHFKAWGSFWDRCDLRFTENPELTEAQRFNCYHIRIAAGTNPRTSVCARGLTGRAYEGHIFWDTDIFLLPLFLMVDRKLARNCLDYRYHTLDGARARARAAGLSGAFFAWESTTSGEDVTPLLAGLPQASDAIPIFTGQQQIHICGDVAFAVWNYWNHTQDEEWFTQYGTEILVEVARFWRSRVNLDKDAYHILKVIGPDEYHHAVEDNAYTNYLAHFNLRTALWACERLKNVNPPKWEQLCSKLELKENELKSWKDIQARLFLPAPDKNGVIEQFRGFFDLKDVNLTREETYRAPILRLLAWQEINRSKILKQADVLMIPFLFPDLFSKEIIAKNYFYYEPKTDHGSSLSPPVHAAIAARISHWEDAKKYWYKSLYFDLYNTMKNTALGMHLGCMGGSWQALIYHFLNIRVSEGIVRLEGTPGIPQEFEEVEIRLPFFNTGRIHIKEVA